jgi:hypothetical protein
MQMVLPRKVRQQMLILEWGVPKKEVVEAIRRNGRIKNQRRQTVNNLKIARVEEVIEDAVRAVDRLVFCKASTNKQVQVLLAQAENAKREAGTVVETTIEAAGPMKRVAPTQEKTEMTKEEARAIEAKKRASLREMIRSASETQKEQNRTLLGEKAAIGVSVQDKEPHTWETIQGKKWALSAQEEQKWPSSQEVGGTEKEESVTLSVHIQQRGTLIEI